MFIVPKRFKLTSQTVDVTINESFTNEASISGRCFTYKNQIEVPPLKHTQRQRAEQVYLHEVTHMILDVIGHNDLSNNEAFVDLFGSLLHQCLTTAEGDVYGE